MKLEKLQNTIELISNSNKIARLNNDMITLLKNGESCLEIAGKMVKDMVEAESAYRKIEAEHVVIMAQGKAETLAKASEEYKEWRYYRALYDILIEMAMMSKKLISTVEKEYNATSNNENSHSL